MNNSEHTVTLNQVRLMVCRMYYRSSNACMAILSYTLRWLPIDRHFPISFLCMPCLWTIYRSQTHSSLSLIKWVFVRRWSAGSFAERCSSYHCLDGLYISCINAYVIIIVHVHNIYTCTCDISSYLSIVFASKPLTLRTNTERWNTPLNRHPYHPWGCDT